VLIEKKGCGQLSDGKSKGGVKKKESWTEGVNRRARAEEKQKEKGYMGLDTAERHMM
jgi:hypothetical protein